MGKQVIRPACAQDVPALSGIKSRYIRALYRGFLSSEYLKKIDEHYFAAELAAWVDGAQQVDVLEQDGVITGFAVYGEDPEDPCAGMIREMTLIPSDSWQGKDPLMQRCLDNLSRRYGLIHAKTLRDNFRTRFMFEQYGFRPDGTQETFTVDGRDLLTIRLARCTQSRNEQE